MNETQEYLIDSDVFPDYRHNGGKALVELHEHHLRAFLETWKIAKARQLKLPSTDDPDYASLDTLVIHVLSAARSYMMWLCKSLGLPDPGIRHAPEPGVSAEEIETHLEHVLECWRTPLSGVEEEQYYRPAHPTKRGVPAGIEAMLQHAVMHAIRHDYQLIKLLDGGKAR